MKAWLTRKRVPEELNDAAKRDILAAIARLGPGGPVTLVVASNGYAEFLDNWLCHMDALGRHRLLIVAMDDDLARRLSGTRFSVARAGFDGSTKDFWLQRARIWTLLAEEGVEFIHSDMDAVWLRDPVQQYVSAEFDLLVSQGTIHPRALLGAWGFILCTGFFWARPTVATRRLFQSLTTPRETILKTDDQAALNSLLVEAGTTWKTGGIETYELEHGGRSFSCFRQPLSGYCAALDLHLVLLPHHLFPRLQPGAPDALVRHVLWDQRDRTPEQRIRQMREVGCWRLDSHPAGFAFPN